MIYSQRNLAVRLLPDTSDCPEAVLTIQGLKGVKAIDYDPLQHFLYWVCITSIISPIIPFFGTIFFDIVCYCVVF